MLPYVRGSTSSTFPGVNAYLQVRPVFPQSPTTELPRPAAHGSVPCECICPADLAEKEGNSPVQEGTRGGTGTRLLVGFLVGGGEKPRPKQLPQQIWHRSGCLAHFKNPFTFHFYFFGEIDFLAFSLPLLTLHPSLAEDLKCTGLGSVRIPLTWIRGFSPQLEGQLRSLHCNIENTVSLDNISLWPLDN